MAYELINWSISTNPLFAFVKGVGETVGASSGNNIVGLFIVLAAVLVTLFSTGFQSLGNTIVASSLIGAVISMLLVPLGLLTSFFVYLFIITLIIGIFFMIYDKN